MNQGSSHLKPADKLILIELAKLEKGEKLKRGKLAERTGKSLKTISDRTKVLEDNGIIQKEIDQQKRLWSLSDSEMSHYLPILCKISSQEQDIESITSTKPDNISYTLKWAPDKGESLLATIYNSGGFADYFEDEIEVNGEEVEVVELMNKLMTHFEGVRDKKLGLLASKLFENYIENYSDIRSEFKAHKEDIVSALTKSSQNQLRITSFENDDMPLKNKAVEHQPDPVLSVAQHSPEVIKDLGGRPEKAAKYGSENFPTERSTFEEIEPVLSEMNNMLDVFTQDEKELMKELETGLAKVIEDGLTLTISRNLAEITELKTEDSHLLS